VGGGELGGGDGGGLVGVVGGGLGLGLELVGLLTAVVFRLGGGPVGVVVVGGAVGDVGAVGAAAGDGLTAGPGSGERVRTGVRDGESEVVALGENVTAGTRYFARPGRTAGVTSGAPLTVPGSFTATAAAVTPWWRLARVATDRPITVTAATAITAPAARRGRRPCRTSGAGASGGGGGGGRGTLVWVASGSRRSGRVNQGSSGWPT
jgi:hypothetical protein